MLGFGFVQLELHRITAAAFTENERAWRLMERVGMRREAHFVYAGFVRGRWVDVFGYAMLADEWAARHADLTTVVCPYRGLAPADDGWSFRIRGCIRTATRMTVVRALTPCACVRASELVVDHRGHRR